jgi:hypothetical protein
MLILMAIGFKCITTQKTRRLALLSWKCQVVAVVCLVGSRVWSVEED